MSDRLPSDHDTVESHRVPLETVGRTDRYRIELPSVLSVEPDDVVRLSFDGTEAHAQIGASLDGTPELRGAFDNARLARDTDTGEDRLDAWIEATGLDAGRSLLLDVLVEGSHFGLRTPGERVVYTVREPPEDSLADIASRLDE